MKISTNITDDKERDSLFEQLKTNYGVVKGDSYIEVLSKNQEFDTYGEVIQYSSENLGADGRLSRVVDIRREIEEGGMKLKNIKEEHINFSRECDKKTLELKDKKVSLVKEIEGIESDAKNLRKDKSVQSRLESLIKQRETTDETIADLINQVENSRLRAEKLEVRWDERKTMLFEALLREEQSIEIIERRLEILYAEKRHVELELSDLRDGEFVSHRIINGQLYGHKIDKPPEICVGIRNDGTPCEALKQKGKETCWQHRGQKEEIKLDTDIENLNQIQRVKSVVSGYIQQENIVPERIREYVKRRNLTNYLTRINAEIEKLQLEVRGGAASRIENTYITRGLKANGEKGGDLVCFSREFSSDKRSLMGEMSYIPRTQADVDVLFQLNKYITWVLGILTVLLFGLLVSNVDIDILNEHTFYWVVGFFLFYHLYNYFLQRDRVFSGLYSYMDWDKIEIHFEDNEGIRKSVSMKCFHLELVNSDQADLFELLLTGVDDIQRYKDSILMSKLENIQKNYTLKETDNINLETHNSSIGNLNQKLAARNERLEGDIYADVHRSYNESAGLTAKNQGTNKYMWMAIMVLGGLFILSWILPRIIPSQINVDASAPNTSWDVSIWVIVGVVLLTAAVIILPSRWMRNSH